MMMFWSDAQQLAQAGMMADQPS